MKAILAIVFALQEFSAGTVLDHVAVGVRVPNGPETVNRLTPGDESTTFDLEPGDYHFTITPRDALDIPLPGAVPVTGEFTVPAVVAPPADPGAPPTDPVPPVTVPVTISVPVSASATVSQA